MNQLQLCEPVLTMNWRADWGGFMQFYANDFNIELGLLPRFNALNMFLPPQEHSVSSVTPFAAWPKVVEERHNEFLSEKNEKYLLYSIYCVWS